MSEQSKAKLITKFADEFKALVKEHSIILDKYANEGKETRYAFKSRQDDSCVWLEDLMTPINHG